MVPLSNAKISNHMYALSKILHISWECCFESWFSVFEVLTVQGCFQGCPILQMNNGSVRPSHRVTALSAPDRTPPVLFRFLFTYFWQISCAQTMDIQHWNLINKNLFYLCCYKISHLWEMNIDTGHKTDYDRIEALKIRY